MMLMSPLTRVMTGMILSVLPVRKHALRFSGQACNHAGSIILSAGSAESIILSARAKSIILPAPPAESMMLSQCRPHMSISWQSVRECALTLRASYSQQAALRE
jgi:hypothetical protein